MLLQNIQSYETVLDLNSRSIINYSIKPKTSGWYNDSDGFMVAIYASQDKLFLQIDKVKFKIDGNFVAEIEKLPNNFDRKFFLYYSNERIAEFEYQAEEPFNHISPFEYFDDESFDWGILLSNIVNNLSRQKIFIENNGSLA